MPGYQNFRSIGALSALALLTLTAPSSAPPALANAAPAKRASPTIDHIGVQLFYGYSGTLSADISPPAEFVGWNSIIGEGDAGGEAVDDLLVTVHLRGKTESNIFAPVSITATNGEGKIVGKRIAEPTLANEKGQAAVALFLHNIGCAGALKITVRMGASLKSETINLDCGE
jgi:hypothetical protein